MTKRFLFSVVVMVVLTAMAASSNAEILSTAANDEQDNFHSVPSNSDLLQTHLRSASILSGEEKFGSSLGSLYNGVYGVNSDTAGGSSFAPSEPTSDPATAVTTVEFLLDTTGVNSNGYDISKVVSLSGYSGHRTCQDFDLYVAKAKSSTYLDSDFNLLYSVDSSLPNNDDHAGYAVKITTDISNELSATGIGAIRLVFNDPGVLGSSAETVYRELDVFTVPEPGTLVLVATGVFGLLAYAWRKRK